MSSHLGVARRVLAGLDGDLIEYIAGLVSDAEDASGADDLQESVAEFLVSSEYCATSDAAAAKAKELWAELLKAGAVKEPKAPKKDKKKKAMVKLEPRVQEEEEAILPAKLEEKEVPLPEEQKEEVKEVKEKKRTTTNAAMWAAKNVWLEDEDYETGLLKSEVVEKKTKAGGRHRRGDKKEESAGSRAYGEALRMLEQRKELRDAQERSVRSRWKIGAYKGAVEAKDFSLANPGGGPDLLEEGSFSLQRGRRYALVGRNGRGKTTLLRAIAARRVGDVPEHCLVHYVSQDVTLTKQEADQYPWEIVVEADVELQMLWSLEKEATSLTEKEKIAERLEACEATTAKRRAETLLSDLGFSEDLKKRPLKALSGGWRVRTFLAAALFSKCDLLFLDEPTNHLSIGAVVWLTKELVDGFKWADRIVVVVSHDRTFLDDISTDVLHVSGVAKRLTQAHGDYETWAKRRKEKKLAWDREKQRRTAEIDKLKEYAGHGFRYGGSSSQIAKMKMKERQAEKLTKAGDDRDSELLELEEDAELPLMLKSGEGYTQNDAKLNLVEFRNVSFKYPNAESMLLANVELGITLQSRIVFVGENGNGKSTLVKLLTGDLEPIDGRVIRDPKARIALVNQHHADQLELSQTPLDFMLSKFPADGSYEHTIKLRSHLANCGVPGANPDLQNTKAAVLSGGQRSRVALAAVSYVEPHVLVLDEPTNNLDLESVQALADSVKHFKGAVVCVSHDQAFVSQVAKECWVVAKGVVRRAPSFEAYVKKQIDKVVNNQ